MSDLSGEISNLRGSFPNAQALADLREAVRKKANAPTLSIEELKAALADEKQRLSH